MADLNNTTCLTFRWNFSSVNLACLSVSLVKSVCSKCWVSTGHTFVEFGGLQNFLTGARKNVGAFCSSIMPSLVPNRANRS